MTVTMQRVLFICTHNSARSQMAEGLLRHSHGKDYEAFSAGTVATTVHPLAIAVMREAGIDISQARSKETTELRDITFDIVITVCDSARESCPFFPASARRLHAGFEDPAALEGPDEVRLQKFRQVRDEIKDWIEECFGTGGAS